MIFKLLVWSLFLNFTSCLNDTIIVDYYESWKYNDLKPSDIQFQGLTHLIYAFVSVDSNANLSIGNTKPLNEIKSLISNKGIKLMISLGGWSGSKYFSIVTNEAKRKSFINNIMNVLNEFQLDGVDFDWEYPGQPGDGNEYDEDIDTVNLFNTVVELRKLIGNDKVISVCGSIYPFTKIKKFKKELALFLNSVDFVNVMAYHYYGSWDNVSGSNSPLYFSPKGSVNQTMNEWERYIPKNKLLLGMPTFGVVFPIKDVHNNSIHQNVIPEKETKKPYTSKELILEDIISYKYINQKILNNADWMQFFDEESNTPYTINVENNLLISYENEKSIEIKKNYVIENGYRGIMLWSLLLDDDGKLLKKISGAPEKKAEKVLNTSKGRINNFNIRSIMIILSWAII